MWHVLSSVGSQQSGNDTPAILGSELFREPCDPRWLDALLKKPEGRTVGKMGIMNVSGASV
jgi:hypothetical protein